MRPLEGVTVVALEQVIAAPLCTRQPADLGKRARESIALDVKREGARAALDTLVSPQEKAAARAARAGWRQPEAGWRITHVKDPSASTRKVYTMWDDAVIVTGPPLPAQRDLLVAALFGPASGAERR